MKTNIKNIRIQRSKEGGGGGTGPTPPPVGKPENLDEWPDNQDEPPPRDPEGEPDFGDDEGTVEIQTPWKRPSGPPIDGEILPKGALGDKGGDDGLDGKGSDITQEWDSALAASRGNAPSGIKRALDRLKRPAIDWRNALDRYIDEAITKSKYDLPNRRFLSGGEAQYGYKTYKEDFESVVVAIDTSGSINDTMIKTFISEVMGIITIYNPQKTVILYCDTQVYAPDILEPGDKPDFSKIKGGGGTNFWPPFKWVERNMIENGEKPSVFIYFTDGEADFPSENQYSIESYADRCVWVFLTFDGEPYENPQPFGERIDIALANKEIKEI